MQGFVGFQPRRHPFDRLGNCRHTQPAGLFPETFQRQPAPHPPDVQSQVAAPVAPAASKVSPFHALDRLDRAHDLLERQHPAPCARVRPAARPPGTFAQVFDESRLADGDRSVDPDEHVFFDTLSRQSSRYRRYPFGGLAAGQQRSQSAAGQPFRTVITAYARQLHRPAGPAARAPVFWAALRAGMLPSPSHDPLCRAPAL